MARFYEQLLIELNATVLQAQYEDFAETINGVIYRRDGNRPINTPERSANLWLTWDFLDHWTAHSGVRYVGDSFINTDNSQRLPSYTVVDIGLSGDLTPDISVHLRGKNIFDEFYAFTSVGNGQNGGQWELGAPRTFEVQLTARF